MELTTTFNPVDPDFYGIVDNLKDKEQQLKVFFFEDDLELNSYSGKIDGIEKTNDSEYLKLQSGERVRLDRIITLNGRPGPLYDYYESFGNACLDCNFEA